MKIVLIKKNRNNVKVVFDNTSYIILDYKVALDFGLRKDDDIDEKKLNELLLFNEKTKAKDYALKLILRRLHSELELKNKLIKRKFRTDIVDEVIKELRTKYYLNDYEFSKNYVEERLYRKKVGLNKIRFELLKKGIDRKIIEEVLSNFDFSSSFNSALELAKKKINSSRYKNLDKNKLKQKLFSFLLSRGFQTDIIVGVIAELKLDVDNF